MKVSDLMAKTVVAVKDTATLGEVARLMWEHDIGFVPVITADSGILAGVITDRDGFIAAYFQGKPIWEIPVCAAMSTRIHSVGPDVEVEEAERVMREFQVHRLPVVDSGNRLVGVLSINDLARSAAWSGDERQEEELAVTIGAICQPRPAETGGAT